MDSQMVTQIVLAYLGTRLVERLKGLGALPWITASTDRINKIVGATIALLATVGIGVASTWDAAAGTFVLTVTGLQVTSILTFLWNWLSQFIMQQIAYHGVVKNGKH